eukprot:15484270-Alexandrium_andersonii.AAC.1
MQAANFPRVVLRRTRVGWRVHLSAFPRSRRPVCRSACALLRDATAESCLRARAPSHAHTICATGPCVSYGPDLPRTARAPQASPQRI